jgi:hypothetical protein
MGEVLNDDTTGTGSVVATPERGSEQGSRERRFHAKGGTLLTNPSTKHKLGQRKDRRIPLKKVSSIVLFAFLR